MLSFATRLERNDRRTLLTCFYAFFCSGLFALTMGSVMPDLKSAYGVISPRKVKIQIEGATVTAVRCDIQAYYAVLATVEYDSGDVVYVSGLTKLASISDIVNLVESVSLT